MKLLRRNTTVFQYRAYAGNEEIQRQETAYINNTPHIQGDGRHGGNYRPKYADPVEYRGHISRQGGYASAQYFGLETKYTHTLLMDNPKADIKETGLIDWNGDTYEITAIRRTINVMAIALQKQTKTGGV